MNIKSYCSFKTYSFSCTLCGECCRDDQIIRLNGEDLELLCNYLNLRNETELKAQGFIEYVFEDPGFYRPRLRFKKKPFAFCPFLKNSVSPAGQIEGFCSLHPHFKPLVCHLSPLARYVESSDGEQFTETWEVLAPVEGCPGMGGKEVSITEIMETLRPRLDREILWVNSQILKNFP